jgi:hypothetical protein
MVALVGLMAAAPIGTAFRALVDRQTSVTERVPPARWRIVIIWFLASIASLAVFGLLFSGMLLWVSRGVPILKVIADQLVWSALKWRLLITVLLIVLSPRRGDLRLPPFDDADARVPQNRCVRFVPAVTDDHATLTSGRPLRLTRAGLSPAGSRQLFLAHKQSRSGAPRDQASGSNH